MARSHDLTTKERPSILKQKEINSLWIFYFANLLSIPLKAVVDVKDLQNWTCSPDF